MIVVKSGEGKLIEENSLIIKILIGLLVLAISVICIAINILLKYSEVMYRMLVTVLLILSALKVVFIAVSLLGILYIIRNRRSSRTMRKAALKAINLLIVPVIFLGRLAGIDKERIQRAYANLNNSIVYSAEYHLMPRDILLLLPHCLQNNECPHRIIGDIGNCVKCGKCSIKDILELTGRYPVKVAVVPGGTLARKMVNNLRPKAVVAVACERDLASGIRDTGHLLPVAGIFNERPNGPCFNTNVDVGKIEEAINYFCNGRCS